MCNKTFLSTLKTSSSYVLLGVESENVYISKLSYLTEYVFYQFLDSAVAAVQLKHTEREASVSPNIKTLQGINLV